MDLQTFIKKTEAFDTDKVLNLSVKSHEAEIVDKNFQEQLYEQGVMPDGKDTPEYSPVTVQFKEAPGSHDHKTDHMTFKDEGDFYSGGNVKINRKSFAIDSRDGKKDKLIADFGDMLGLTKQSIAELSDEFFREDLQLAAHKAIL